MPIDRFPSIRFMTISTVIVSIVSQSLNLLCNSTATRKPYSISPTVSPKARHPHHFLCNLFLPLVFCFCNVCGEIKGSLSTDVREPRTATGSRMFPFWAWFCSLPRTEKALVDDCVLTLQTRWRKNAPKTRKFNFRLPSVAQKHLCLSSLLKLIEWMKRKRLRPFLSVRIKLYQKPQTLPVDFHLSSKFGTLFLPLGRL